MATKNTKIAKTKERPNHEPLPRPIFFCASGVFCGQKSSRGGQALSQSKGFTLVELLIGMSLALTVMTAVLTSYIFLGRSLVRLANQQTLETEARRALAFFAQDVRMASDLDTSGAAPKVTPDTYKLTFTLPTASTTKYITYYFNDTSSDDASTLPGYTLPAHSLVRIDLSAGTSLTLCRNITSGGLAFTYYDSSGNAYTSYTDYLSGIKRLALQFSTQTGVSSNGTQTPVYQFASPQLTLRNRSLLQ